MSDIVKVADELATTPVPRAVKREVEDRAVAAEVPDEVATVVPSSALPVGVILR